MPVRFTTLDTETCGFTGPIVLLQYALNDGEVVLHSPFRRPIRETLDIIESLTATRILGFNLVFDWFKIQQAWTTLRVLGNRVGLDELPLNHVDAYALAEPTAMDGPCLKPLGAFDLMLHARKGPWQNLMARDPIKIRRVPTVLAKAVAAELERRIQIPNIFFAKRKNKHESLWKIRERTDPDFVDIELPFAPSSALKALATQELGLDPLQTLVFSDVGVDKKFNPVENEFAPFALSVGTPENWRGGWPDVIREHDSHWAHNPLARKYAGLDIDYPRRLYEKWGSPAFDDDDSVLACAAGAIRWKGYAVNLKGIGALLKKAQVQAASAPKAPAAVRAYLEQVLSAEERAVLKDKKTGNITTKRVVLEEVTKLKECSLCSAGAKHDKCLLTRHRAAKRAQLVIDARKGTKKVELFSKLLTAKRFFVLTNIIGARSSRNSGGSVSEGKTGKKSGKINPQGINKQKMIRAQFPLAWTEGWSRVQELRPAFVEWEGIGYPISPEKLVGGDFDSFEVNIADAYYEDPKLHEDLTAFEIGRDGVPSSKIQKIHAVVGTLVYPHACQDPQTCEATLPECPEPHTYWSIRDSETLEGQRDRHGREIINLYTRAKSGLFALIYFGNEKTLEDRLGIPQGTGTKAMAAIMGRYQVMGMKREEFRTRFCPMSQADGIGTMVSWTEPEDEVKSMLGFTRSFSLENKCIRVLYELQDDLPESWRQFKVKVVRRDREQTPANAVRSALLAAGFGLQGANMRAAGNHVIQSTGAGLTKRLQRRIWDIQPSGINSWLVRPMNVHDELPTAIDPSVEGTVKKIQTSFIAEHRGLIPLLGMKWKHMYNWSGK